MKKLFPSVQALRDEFSYLYKILEKLKSPVVFCHNDLLLGNVIYTENLKKVTFIDYEYADYNYQAFDIGNHFAEFAGKFRLILKKNRLTNFCFLLFVFVIEFFIGKS